MVIGAALLLVLAILYTATIFFHALTHESTDDAFIDAHIVSIAPKIAGRISAVRVRDNELVQKGDLLLEIDPRDVAAMVAQKRRRARCGEGASRERADDAPNRRKRT